MNRFEWNKHSVCLNPEKVFEHQIGKGEWAVIRLEVAEHGGNWYEGSTRSLGNGCNSRPVSKGQYSKAYATREEAIRAGADDIYLWLLEKKRNERCSLAPAQPFFDWRDSLYQISLF